MFTIENGDRAYQALPKRTQPIKLETAHPEVFFGLYAREKRSFFGFCVWFFVLLLAPALFFFLWLYCFGKSSELPIAAVPLSITLPSLALLFAQLVHSREDG